MARPVDPRGLPPGGGEYTIQPQFLFSALSNSHAQAYLTRFDTALRASRENSWRMRLDPIIETCLDVRVTPTALLPVSVKPQDDTDPQQVAAAKRQQALLRMMPRRAEFRKGLLKEALFVGRSAAQITWGWTYDAKVRRTQCYPSGYSLINGDKVQFKWNGEAGIAIGAGTPLASHERTVMLDSFPVYFPTEDERVNFVVHRSFSEDADYYRPWFAGSIHGIGLRAKLYWTWALKSQLWQMGVDFLRWFSRGLTVYFYEHGNDAHRLAIEDAVARQDGSSAVMYPVFGELAGTNGKPYMQKPFEHIDVSTASPAFLQNLITQYLDDLFRFAILHQSLTTSTGATGMGSGVAGAHQTTFDNLIKMDATCLDDTETQELLAVMYATNEPGVPCGRVVSQSDSPNVEQLMSAAQTIVGLGGTVPASPLLEAAGIPEPKDGETLLGNVAVGQPAAVENPADGMPLQTAADDPNAQPV